MLKPNSFQSVRDTNKSVKSNESNSKNHPKNITAKRPGSAGNHDSQAQGLHPFHKATHVHMYLSKVSKVNIIPTQNRFDVLNYIDTNTDGASQCTIENVV